MSEEKEIVLCRPRQFLPKQKQVFDLIFQENLGENGKLLNNYGLYSGAYGAGKTLLLAQVGIKASMDYPGAKGLVGSLSYTQLKDVIFQTFIDEIDGYQRVLNDNNIPIQIAEHTISPGKMNITFYNGSEIMFRACEDSEKLKGRNLEWFMLDEPIEMKAEVFKQLMARLRGGNMPFHFGLLATNPGAENHWIYQYFYMDKKPGYFAVDTNTYDNILIPNYEEYIKSMEARYDPDWVRRYLEGHWGAFSGQIYKMFNTNKHVRDFDQDLKNVPGIERYIAGVDFGIRDPTCILVLMKTKANTLFVISEFYESEKTSFEIANIIKKLHLKYNFTKVYCDPSAADLVKQAFDLGVPIGKFDNNEVKSYANNAVAPGIAKLQSTFKADHRITIHSSCTNLIRSIQSYRYKNADNDIPLKDDDHAADALRYALTDYNPIPDETEFGCGHFKDRLGRLRRAT